MSTSFVPYEQSSHLAKLDQARQALAECRTPPDVLEIRDKAEAIRLYMKFVSGKERPRSPRAKMGRPSSKRQIWWVAPKRR
jgi:hypothetical protein